MRGRGQMAMEERGSLQMMFWRWWYAEAVTSLWRFLIRSGAYIADLFSVKLCLTTLFEVWRRDEIDTSNLSIQDKLYVWSLNNSSRLVGFVVKILVLAAFVVLYVISWLLGLSIMVIYLAFPALILVLVIYSLYCMGVELTSGIK